MRWSVQDDLRRAAAVGELEQRRVAACELRGFHGFSDDTAGPAGRAELAALEHEWTTFADAMAKLLRKDGS